MPSQEKPRRPIKAMLGMIACMVGIVIASTWMSTRAVRNNSPAVPEYSVESVSTFVFDQTNGVAADVPGAIRSLDGHRVSLIGQMWAGQTSADFLKTFQLVPLHPSTHNVPLVQRFIYCQSATPIPYLSEDNVRVTGIFHVDVQHDENGVTQVFRLDAERVEPIPAPPPNARPMPITFFSPPGATSRPAVPTSSWYIVSIAVSLPLLIGSRYLRYRWRKQRRRITGRCLTCGSELRGSVDQCPECGGTFIEQYSGKSE